MRHAQCEGLIDAVLGETIPMHGRMLHGRRQTGELSEESQQYDVHGRVCTYTTQTPGMLLIMELVYPGSGPSRLEQAPP